MYIKPETKLTGTFGLSFRGMVWRMDMTGTNEKLLVWLLGEKSSPLLKLFKL